MQLCLKYFCVLIIKISFIFATVINKILMVIKYIYIEMYISNPLLKQKVNKVLAKVMRNIYNSTL